MRKRGRPPRDVSSDLSSQIIAVANDFFLRDGFQATSMDAIAARLGSSKRTLYTRFSSKNQLFEAVVRHHSDRSLDLARAGGPTGDTFRAFLVSCGRRALELALEPASIALFRLMISERQRFPDLGLSVLVEPVGLAVEALRPEMERAMASGLLPAGDAAEMAEHFLLLVCARDVVRVVLGLEEAGATPERLRRVEGIVALFLGAEGEAAPRFAPPSVNVADGATDGHPPSPSPGG